MFLLDSGDTEFYERLCIIFTKDMAAKRKKMGDIMSFPYDREYRPLFSERNLNNRVVRYY